jgi:hypothetical protein
MTNTELLTEPELPPIVEAYLTTKRDYELSLNTCGWSMSLESFGWYKGQEDLLEKVESNRNNLAERAKKIALALSLGEHFTDFLNLGVDLLAYEYEQADWAYRRQQQEIADAPRRAWAMAYNARLAEIDKQIKGAKSRRSRTWTKWRKNAMPYNTALMLVSVIDLEIAEIEKRRELLAAETFESVAA